MLIGAFVRGNRQSELPVQYVPFIRTHDPMNLNGSASSSDDTATKSKHERLQELRRQHQRSHRERRGHYPLDEKEDVYERQIQEYEKVSRCIVDTGRCRRRQTKSTDPRRNRLASARAECRAGAIPSGA